MHLQITNLNEAGKFKSKRHVWTTNIPIIAQIDKYKTEYKNTKKILTQIAHFFRIFPLVIVDWGGLRQQVFLRTEREWEGNYCSKGLKIKDAEVHRVFLPFLLAFFIFPIFLLRNWVENDCSKGLNKICMSTSEALNKRCGLHPKLG